MYDFFKNINEKRDKVWFSTIGDNPRSITYGEYYDNICECYEKIRERCSDIKGKHVGVLVENTYEYTVILGALFMGRALIVPINTYEVDEIVNYIIDNADVEILIVSDKFARFSSDITLSLSEITSFDASKHYDFDDSIDECIEETSFMMYTSGTTGRPKGVIQPLSCHLNLMLKNFDVFRDFLSSIKAIYVTLPLYHVMGFYYYILSLKAGCVLYLNSDVGEMLYELETIKPDLVVATPAFIKILEIATKKTDNNGTDNLKYVVSGGADLKRSLVDKLKEKGIVCFNAYGMTETAGAGTFNFDTYNHLGSIGVASPNADIKFIDGEICISCDSMMKGYYKNDEATAECLIDGYMHTGDLGYIDEEGYIYITGRKKNLIILSGGENISPEEIETKVYQNPLIKECIVFEKNDRIALAVYAPDASEDEVRNYVSELNEKLPIFKRIYSIEMRDGEFDKTASGKIKRS